MQPDLVSQTIFKNQCRKNIRKPFTINNNKTINNNYVCTNHNNDIQLCNMYGCNGKNFITFNYNKPQNNNNIFNTKCEYIT